MPDLLELERFVEVASIEDFLTCGALWRLHSVNSLNESKPALNPSNSSTVNF